MPPKFHPALLQFAALSPVLWWFGKRLNDGNDEPLGLLTFALALVLAWRARICGVVLVLSLPLATSMQLFLGYPLRVAAWTDVSAWYWAA